ncbi:alpha-L-rhamnosidase-like protein [Pedobacter psychrotolerans]|uniref:Alpha-L-rhamnosidase-like protein n=1 Tax=Pedobacter psychrotolerans TaxID=1843235 RepID=A0A4R2H3L9_9SPHI|nr:family 78 glycoside hydrolase catalytic domain [Pedobacter psychrotolerans]TCO19908.1 alpha-L-rhamnosidase-like protein [Pedobacter psychrotolerans]GGE49752.1 alpha-rhamnosidase [Pedobacter psychrotolerans]
MKNLKKTLLLSLLSFLIIPTFAQKASWIWYPGDFDIYMSNVMQNRRTERGSFFPVFWKMDSHYVLVDFHKEFTLSQPEEVKLFVEGTYNVKIDGQAITGFSKSIQIPAGKHKFSLKVYSQGTVPAIFVQGKTIVSDETWLTTFEDKEWIDQSGKVSDKSGTTFVSAGSWNLTDPNMLPSKFKLPVVAHYAVNKEKAGNDYVADFGKETFGFLKIHGLKGNGKLDIYYGESREEALSTDKCETLDHLDLNLASKKDSVMPLSKAFRYVNFQAENGVTADSISMLYEYAPVTERGSFKSSDTELNKIYDVAKYTFHLNTREFFIDGIKRDRWVWSGDAYQSYLMNYYSFFDAPTVKRTLLAQRGKDPVTAHINTIMDYSFYWFLGIYDYYKFTGDKKFVQDIYPRMQSLMTYIDGRKNKNGLLEWMPGDWIFIDWADKLSKDGEVSFEQLLYARSLETMALCAKLANDTENATKYDRAAKALKTKIFELYWNQSKHALVHSRIADQLTDNVTRYANMFGIFFDYFTPEQKLAVKENVLLNDKIAKITTPYMRFYELEALCAMGEQSYVLKEMKSYWGGMLKLEATSFWEEYNPDKKGVEHLEMYGRPFGKSLCHAWGASPIYLLGKYYLGVSPDLPGYETYTIQPNLGGLGWMEGKVPTANGDISVYMNKKEIRVSAAAGTGKLILKSKSKPVVEGAEVKEVSKDVYEVKIEKNMNYAIGYNPPAT